MVYTWYILSESFWHKPGIYLVTSLVLVYACSFEILLSVLQIGMMPGQRHTDLGLQVSLMFSTACTFPTEQSPSPPPEAAVEARPSGPRRRPRRCCGSDADGSDGGDDGSDADCGDCWRRRHSAPLTATASVATAQRRRCPGRWRRPAQPRTQGVLL